MTGKYNRKNIRMDRKTQLVLEWLIHKQDLLCLPLTWSNKFVFSMVCNAIIQSVDKFALKISNVKFISVSYSY